MSRYSSALIEGEIAVVGSATSHALASVRAIRELDSGRGIVAVGFDDASVRTALEQSGVRAATELPKAGGLVGVIFAEDMAEHVSELSALMGARVPVFIHKPAVRDRWTLRLMREALLNAPELALIGSILRFSPALSDLDMTSAAAVDVEVRHPLAARRAGEAQPVWGARIARDFGVHGLDVLDRVGRRPRRCQSAAWVGGERNLTLKVCGRHGVDQITVMGTTDDESYVVTDGVHRIALLDAESDPLGHTAAHRAFLSMIGGAPSPVAANRSLVVLAATLDAADRAATAVPTKEREQT